MVARSQRGVSRGDKPAIAGIPPGMDSGTASVELASHRTGMAFQRTRMSADNTLMSVIRTSLSLISFGFTIFQFFRKIGNENMLHGDVHATRNFGEALVYLGVVMLAAAIVYHLQFMWALRRERSAMVAEGLVYAETRFPPSLTLIVAVLLLLIGLAAVASLSFNVGPFG